MTGIFGALEKKKKEKKRKIEIKKKSQRDVCLRFYPTVLISTQNFSPCVSHFIKLQSYLPGY